MKPIIQESVLPDRTTDPNLHPLEVLQDYEAELFAQTLGLLQSDIYEFEMDEFMNTSTKFIGWTINIPILRGKLRKIMNIQFQSDNQDYPVEVQGFTGNQTILASNPAKDAIELRKRIDEVLANPEMQAILHELWKEADTVYRA